MPLETTLFFFLNQTFRWIVSVLEQSRQNLQAEYRWLTECVLWHLGEKSWLRDSEALLVCCLPDLLSLAHRQRALLVNRMSLWNTCPLMPCLCPQVTRQTIYIHLPDILYNSKATSSVPGSLTLNGLINSQARNTALTQFLYQAREKPTET